MIPFSSYDNSDTEEQDEVSFLDATKFGNVFILETKILKLMFGAYHDLVKEIQLLLDAITNYEMKKPLCHKDA